MKSFCTEEEAEGQRLLVNGEEISAPLPQAEDPSKTNPCLILKARGLEVSGDL